MEIITKKTRIGIITFHFVYRDFLRRKKMSKMKSSKKKTLRIFGLKKLRPKKNMSGERIRG